MDENNSLAYKYIYLWPKKVQRTRRSKPPVSIQTPPSPSSDATANLDTRIRGLHTFWAQLPPLPPLIDSVEVLIIRFHFNIFRSRRVEIFSIGIHLVVFGQVVGVSSAHAGGIGTKIHLLASRRTFAIRHCSVLCISSNIVHCDEQKTGECVLNEISWKVIIIIIQLPYLCSCSWQDSCCLPDGASCCLPDGASCCLPDGASCWLSYGRRSPHHKSPFQHLQK